MRILLLLFILLSARFLIACNTKKDVKDGDDYIVKDVIVTSIIDVPEPPLSPSGTRFQNIHDWLANICDTEKPKKPIETYNIGLIESPGDYILTLTGTNTYEISPSETEIRTDFQPREMYFFVSWMDHKHLQRNELLESLSAQIKTFLRTEKFKGSFHSQAKSIILDWEGEIWSK